MGTDPAEQQVTGIPMKRKATKQKRIRPAGRAAALLAGFVLLFSAAYAEEEDIDLNDLLDLTEIEVDEDEIEILPPDATLLARDKQWHTPAEGSLVQCDHEVCYWKLPMGYTDEAAVWQVLIQPITVLDANQRHQVKIRKEPDKNCTVYTGEVTGASQGVHVLERGDEWSLIEAYSSSPEGSKVKVWAEKFQGYVETSPLERNPRGRIPGHQLDGGFLPEGRDHRGRIHDLQKSDPHQRRDPSPRSAHGAEQEHRGMDL